MREMNIVIGRPIEGAFECKLLFVKGDFAVFQGRTNGGMPSFYWVQTEDGEVVFFSDCLGRCVEVAFEVAL